MGAFTELVQRLEGAANPANPANLSLVEPPDSQYSQYSQGVRPRISRQLAEIVRSEGLDPGVIRHLTAHDLDACNGLSIETLRAYVRGLHEQAQLGTGTVPEGWTEPVTCRGCGPVLLWPGCPSHVIACPWCRHRKAGTAIPTPPPTFPT